jgi:arylsulfatase/arylsulfatase A
MIRSVDNNFGRLRAVLKELGLEENTLLIFLSDNGPCSGSQPVDRYMAGLHGLKGTVYENGIRVPCFMRWPAGFKGPAKVTRLAAHIDVLPTVLEACGMALAPKLDGTSLLPLLRNPAALWPDRTLFFQWDSGQTPRRGHAYAVLTERWKLVQPCGMDLPSQRHIRDRYAGLCRLQGRGERSIEGPPRYELYDIAADPGETKDVAAAHPEIVAKMKQQYEAWFDDVAARWFRQPKEPTP